MAAKVLLVEDDNNLREIYQARLSAEGYDIIAAQDGEEALVSAKKEHPDLIISDVMMPRISGFEMLDILRNTEELKNTKVIMLTALGQSEDQTRADSLGANRYLVKSQVTLEDIVKSAQELLGEAGVIEVPDPPAVAVAETTPAAEAAAPATPTPAAPVAVAAPVASAPVAEPTPVTPTPVATDMPTEPTTPPVVAAPVVDTPTPVITPVADTAPITVPDLTTKAVPAPDTTTAAVPEPAVVPVATEPVAASAPDPVPTVVDEQTPEPETDAMPAPLEVVPAVEAVAAVEAPIEPVSSPTPAPVAETPVASTPPVVAAPAEPAEPLVAVVPEAPAADTSSAIAAPESAVIDSAPQTLEDEEAAIAKQIDSYAATSAEPAATAPVQTTEEVANQANDDAVIAGAVEQLEAGIKPEVAAPAEPAEPLVAVVPEAPAAAPAAETPVASTPPVVAPPAEPAEPPKTTSAPTSATSENVSVAGKKVIKPINDKINAPDLNELLAKEAAKQEPAAPTPIVNGQPSDSQKPFDPNAISL